MNVIERKAGFSPPRSPNRRLPSVRTPARGHIHHLRKPRRPLTSNRLSGINLATGGTRAYAYDAAGNVATDSRGAGYVYTSDAAGRMATMSINGVLQGSYKYDFAGRQVVRTLTSPTAVTIHSVFDSDGRRIAEYNEGTGALIREYVWLGWEPIAVIEGGVVSFIRTDHIGRPVFATNAAGTKVWTASYTPFGGVRTTTGTPINARFPGQWFQSESGLHQNWMRDYDPTTGRYLQADPLGLVDGASVYGYAGQSPMMYADPTGECIGPLAGACFNAGVFLIFLAIDMYLDEDCNYTWEDFGWFAADYMMPGPRIGGGRGGAGRHNGGGDGPNSGGPGRGGGGDGPEGGPPGAGPGRGGERPPRIEPSQSDVWGDTQPFRGDVRTNGERGRDRRYYTYDRTHGDIEVFDRRGNHLGSMDPVTGLMTKPAVPGRTIDL